MRRVRDGWDGGGGEGGGGGGSTPNVTLSRPKFAPQKVCSPASPSLTVCAVSVTPKTTLN